MLRSILADLARRKLAHWGLAYLAGAWLLLQAVDLLAQPFGWPGLVLRAATVVLAVGFFAALVLAWYHGEKGAQRVSGVELLMLAALLIVAGAAVVLVRRGGGSGSRAMVESSGSPRALASGLPVATGNATDAGPGGAPASYGATSPVEQGSIAVLPFTDMSPGRDQEYFSDGLTEELLAALSQLPELRVAARTSAFAFKGHEIGIDSIARALRVAHVLEGSVRKAGDRVRITAQLIDARSGYHLWSGTYERDLRDIFAVQDEISRTVVAQLRLRLSAERTGAPLARHETADPEAHALLLRAKAVGRTGLVGGETASIALLRQALQRDPYYARAHAELALNLRLAAYFRHVPRQEGYRESGEEARRALTLDSLLPEAHTAFALVAEWRDWKWPEAERHYRRALELNPNDARAHGNLAWLLARLRRSSESIAEARRATELDPLSPELQNTLATVYMYADSADEALQGYRAALALEPRSAIWLSNVAQVHAMTGRWAEALRVARRARAGAPHEAFAIGILGYVAGRAGERAEAEAALRDLQAGNDVSDYLKAMVHAALGRTDRAFELLERSIARRDEWAADMTVDPNLDLLRGDPRMAALIRKAGLPP